MVVIESGTRSGDRQNPSGNGVTPFAKWPNGTCTTLDEGLWQRPNLRGYQESLRGLGGIVAPLLTGFSLAAIATLVSADETPPLTGWAILALSGAAGLLLYSMQVAFLALERNPSPSDLLAWYPDGAVDTASLTWLREKQARDFAMMQRYESRHQWTYELGIILFLAGLGLLVWPSAAHGSAERYAAVGVVAIAWIVEVAWNVLRIINHRREPSKRLWHPALLPEPETTVSKLDSVEIAAMTRGGP